MPEQIVEGKEGTVCLGKGHSRSSSIPEESKVKESAANPVSGHRLGLPFLPQKDSTKFQNLLR